MDVRRSIAVAAALLAAPLMASCGVNFDAQTDQPYNPAAGVNDRSGAVDVLNALVVSATPGSGTVAATLVNNSELRKDTLRTISGAGSDSSLTVKVTGDKTIPAGGVLNLAKTGQAKVQGKQVSPGKFVRITFSFDRARSITLDVPVMSSKNPDYADVPTS